MTRRITRFSVHKTAFTIGSMYGLVGFIFWPAILLTYERHPWFILALPIFLGVLGYLMVAAYCLLYNLTSRWTGGIEFTVEARG